MKTKRKDDNQAAAMVRIECGQCAKAFEVKLTEVDLSKEDDDPHSNTVYTVCPHCKSNYRLRLHLYGGGTLAC